MNIKKIKKRILFIKNKAVPAVKLTNKAIKTGIKLKGVYLAASKIKSKK